MKKIASIFAFAVLFSFALHAQDGNKPAVVKPNRAPAPRAVNAPKPKTTLVKMKIAAKAVPVPARRAQSLK